MDLHNKTKEQIRQEIKGTLTKIAKINKKELEDGTLIREELGIDSLMFIEIIANVEKHYDIKIDEQKILSISTVVEFVSYIENLL